MPSTVTYNKITVPTLDKQSLKSIPEWAHAKYRQSEEMNIQLTTNIIKLEKNIADLETMLQKNECPRSIQVKIEVKVKQTQQNAMDQALFEAKKVFHNSVLQALIAARKSELTEVKTKQSKLCSEFINFLQENIETIQRHNIPLIDEDSDAEGTLQYAKHLYEEQAQKIASAVKTEFLFRKLEEQKKNQIRQAQAEERRLNTQLRDPEISMLQDRLQKLEVSIKKQKSSKTRTRSSITNDNIGKSKSTNNVNRPFPQRRPAGKKKKNLPENVSKRIQRNGNKNQGQGQGNRKPRRRYTNTTNRSASLPPNSRKRQN